MSRRHVLAVVGVLGVFLAAGSANAELVRLTFDGTVTEWWAEYEGYYCGGQGGLTQTSYEDDVYAASFDLVFDIEHYSETSGTFFGIPWTAIFADGAFSALDATGGGGSLHVDAAELAGFETSWNYGAGTYDSVGSSWLAAGTLDAGGANREYDDYSGYSEGVNGLLAAGGSSSDGVVYATGSLIEWSANGSWGDCCLAMNKEEHGYCFDGVLTGFERVVPEPASLTLLGLGLAGLAAARFKRRGK